MATKPRTQKIASLFQKFLKSQDKSLIEYLSLEELEDTDIDLGVKDIGRPWRLAIQDRIIELKQKGQEKITEQMMSSQENKAEKRHLQTFWLEILSVLVAIILTLMGWFYFN